MANHTLTPEVRDILERSTITENKLVLPPGQLERKLYESVNKAITFAGGKWSTPKKAHLFTGDPRQKLGLMLETGVAVDEKKKFQAFFTPEDLAQQIIIRADVAGKVVLEPSAGAGSLVTAALRAGAKQVDCVEINEEHRQALIGQKRAVTISDFLTERPFPYERIVMNPPFTKNQDVAHVRHALRFLAPGGVLVAIVMDNQERKPFRDLLADITSAGLSHRIEHTEAGAFKSSGTGIATLILTVQ